MPKSSARWPTTCQRDACTSTVDGRLYPVIWPSGTRIESDDPIAIKTKGQMIEEGDSVMGGGRLSPTGQVRWADPDECHGTTSEVAVFNADSEIEVTRP